jgi:hypothetical protein
MWTYSREHLQSWRAQRLRCAGSIAAGIGALSVKHATPGMSTLGSMVANVLVQQAAISAFGFASSALCASAMNTAS